MAGLLPLIVGVGLSDNSLAGCGRATIAFGGPGIGSKVVLERSGALPCY